MAQFGLLKIQEVVLSEELRLEILLGQRYFVFSEYFSS
jgi:hypothetical protein